MSWGGLRPRCHLSESVEVAGDCHWYCSSVAYGYYQQGMKTLTMKVPDGLLSWLENEARRVGQPKSALVREILQQYRQRRSKAA